MDAGRQYPRQGRTGRYAHRAARLGTVDDEYRLARCACERWGTPGRAHIAWPAGPTLGWLQAEDRSAGQGPGRVQRIVTPVTTARLYVASAAALAGYRCDRQVNPPPDFRSKIRADNGRGSGQRTSVYWLPSSWTTRKLLPETSLRRCRIPLMPATATATAAARIEPPKSASPPATFPSSMMTTPASRAA